MGNLKNINILLFVLLFATLSCNKGDETLVLDEEYLSVSDISRYCTGSCDVVSDWENRTALVKGYIKGAENDSLMQEFYNKSLFYLEDIRSGLSIEVRITGDRDAIFSKLNTVRKTAMIYVKGVATPVTAYDGDKCTKGMVLSIDNANSVSLEKN